MTLLSDESYEGRKLTDADHEVLRAARENSDVGVVKIESAEQLNELARAARRTMDFFEHHARDITDEQATVIRRLRVDENFSWRAVAGAMFHLGLTWIGPPTNQIAGMALCQEAARRLGEDFKKAPWN